MSDRILVVEPDLGTRARLIERLPEGSAVTELSSTGEVESRLDTERAVVVVGPGVAVVDALAFASQLREERTDVAVVVIADDIGVEHLQEALRTGVRDILPSVFTVEQMASTLERIAPRAQAPAAWSREGAHQVVTVFSSKGGVGKSFIAANLAMALARRGAPVALVDLDLQFGDLAIMLQLFPARTIHDAATATGELDEDALDGYLAAHRGGVKLLAAPFEPGLAETVAPTAVTKILRVLRSTFAYVVVDTPAALNEHVIAAIDESSKTVLVGSMDVPSIKNMKLALQTLSLLDVPRERIHLVLNRADSEVGLRVHEVERTLGTKVEVSIPSGREVPLSINRGVPLMLDAPTSAVAGAMQRLTALVCETDEPAAAPAAKEGGWLRRKSR